MDILPGFIKSIATTRSSLIAVVAIVVGAICAMGVAAFVGLLPASDHVAVTITATPFIDLQVADHVGTSRSTH